VDASEPRSPTPHFVEARGQALYRAGVPYRFVGVNFWYGAYLGAASGVGDVERLRAELDLLASLGVTNVRVLGASEAGPMKHSITPAFRTASAEYNQTLLAGLDRLLAELAERDMQAVIYLNNFWEWSGGMGTYLSWVNGGKFVDMSDPEHPWPAYPLFTMRFYESAAANALYRDYVRALVTRDNTVTGRAYREDPTIMAWQLANEPRPGAGQGEGEHVLPAYVRWVRESAAFIKGLDPNHMVSTGSEGVAGCIEDADCFSEAHRTRDIDYLTLHLWPKNWGWLGEGEMADAIDRVLDNAGDYIDRHVELARELEKPLVLEEFGLPRDAGDLEPGSPTTYRDRFLAFVFQRVEKESKTGGPLVGSNLWGWGGLGRAAHPNRAWQAGDSSYTGDPPQEPQGLNSVFDLDKSTLELLRAHARRLR
jgi:mannan endo-1,4-beta-mannosidase